ncbi:hypothetical protein R3P38DRAFT_2815841 [Favolaschia claudopus]|uniref:Uncharacterized protein n=1 Tax=Favolaschia claudopus TaxID=2862362 RepID=A0AAV9Z0V1_9AGAR
MAISMEDTCQIKGNTLPGFKVAVQIDFRSGDIPNYIPSLCIARFIEGQGTQLFGVRNQERDFIVLGIFDSGSHGNRVKANNQPWASKKAAELEATQEETQGAGETLTDLTFKLAKQIFYITEAKS